VHSIADPRRIVGVIPSARKRLLRYRRICRNLWRIQRLKVNHKRVPHAPCARTNCFSAPKAIRSLHHNSRHEFPIVPNLTRDLVPTGLDQIWVADIAYVRLAGRFVYLAERQNLCVHDEARTQIGASVPD